MITRVGLLTGLLTMLTVPAAALAQGEAAAGLDPLERLTSTLRGELDQAQLTVQGIRVGRDSLNQVERRLGAAPHFAPGGITELVAVCYLAGEGDDDEALVLQADGNDRDAVVLMAHATRRRELLGMVRHCRISPALDAGIHTAGGLRLGSARANLSQQLAHSPSEDTAFYTGFYFYEPKQPRAASRPRAFCQLLSGLRAKHLSGRVASFTIYRFSRGNGC